jgi:hypothetical protein
MREIWFYRSIRTLTADLQSDIRTPAYEQAMKKGGSHAAATLGI